MKHLLILISINLLISCNSTNTNGPYMATGIKIGEVTQSKAIVWVRLTKNSERIGSEAPIPIVKYIDNASGELIERKGRPDLIPVVTFPENSSICNIEGAVPGSEGQVRLKYKAIDATEWIQLNFEEVDSLRDYSHQFRLSGLQAGTKYEIIVEAASLKRKKISTSIHGGFKTAFSKESLEDVNFIVTTGTSYPDVDSDTGYKLYPSSLKLDPEFFVHTGDIVYYDFLGKTAELARWHWDRMYSYPNNIEFHRQVSSYFIKDDHDTWMDDAFPEKETRFMGDLTYEEGTKIFLDEVPMGEKTYRTIRWGKDLQIWLVEGRNYRSKNTMEDGSDKTIWGKEQMDWFKSSVEASDASFKLLLSATPVVGPDRSSKNDNHSNIGFQYEGDVIREFISKQKNMFIVCGDRHWQYISKDAKSGAMEFSCGPGSNAHAGGWSQDNKLPEHIYLNVVGGFMEGSVSHVDGKAVLTFRHYNPDGEMINEYVVD